MAARKPPRDSAPSQGRPAGGRSLRDQVKALSHLLRPAPAPAPPPARPPVAPPRDEGITFEQLVAGAAGKPPRAAGEPLRAAGEPLRAAPSPEQSGPPTAQRDRRARLWVEQGEGVVRARAEDIAERVLLELERGRIVPRRQIDLHRLSAAGARETLDREIPRARRENVPCLLVVCGRGTHSSPDPPVLPEVAVERLSEALADDVLAFASAPRRWGGHGALLVVLRPPERPAESSR